MRILLFVWLAQFFAFTARDCARTAERAARIAQYFADRAQGAAAEQRLRS